jgi:LPS sulfotransferase NodH
LRGYVICTVPRSGSNWLGQLLASTGRLGQPLEYFNAAARRALTDPDYPDNPRLQVERVLTMGSTPNGIYGLKLFAPQFREIEKGVRLTRDLPNLRFLFLRRRDLLGQAISWTRALQANQYRASQPLQGEWTYDGPFILARLRQAVEEYAQWSAYFARTGQAPLEVAYEDMLEDPRRVVEQVAALFGLSGRVRVRPEAVDIAIQRDAMSEDWRRRFLAEHGDMDRLSNPA